MASLAFALEELNTMGIGAAPMASMRPAFAVVAVARSRAVSIVYFVRSIIAVNWGSIDCVLDRHTRIQTRCGKKSGPRAHARFRRMLSSLDALLRLRLVPLAGVKPQANCVCIAVLRGEKRQV